MAKLNSQEALAKPTNPDVWEQAHKKARAASCIFRITNPTSYERYPASSHVASGNIVDSSRGLVLTSRHVVGDGVSYGHVVLKQTYQYNYSVLYRDPLHDFAYVGLLTADRSIPTGLPEEITLDPGRALQNTEIHRVSNESSLGGNIGQGYIGRTDCNPPCLTGWHGDDMNTEYLALSMVSQGGSSGSLAVNCDGYGVALTCSSNLLNCFMLPLDLPLRALRKLQRGERITRGTLQVKWELKILSDCKNCGLDKKWVDKFEARGVTNLVCAYVVLPNGPVDGEIEVGDILLELDGELVTSMVQVEIYMDDHVHAPVNLTAWGAKGVIRAECIIEDLHALTPNHILMRNGSVFHSISFWVAVHYNIPVQGVLVARTSIEPFQEMMLLNSINGIPITGIEQLAKVLHDVFSNDLKLMANFDQKALGDHGDPISNLGYLLKATNQVPCELRRQPPEGGPWVITVMSPPTSVPSPFADLDEPVRLKGRADSKDKEVGKEGDYFNPLSQLRLSTPDRDIPEEVVQVFSSFVSHDSYRDINVDGVVDDDSQLGVIIDAERGLAVTFRNKLNLLNEVVLTMAGRERVRARVHFLHSAHNLALLKFDPASVNQKVLRACLLAPADSPALEQGSEVFYVPFNIFNRTVTKTKITNLDETNSKESEKVPSKFFKFRHMTCRLKDESASGDDREGGLLLNAEGQIVALVDRRRKNYYLPVHELWAAIKPVIDGRVSDMWFRDFDVNSISLSNAIQLGLSNKRASCIQDTRLLDIGKVPLYCALPSKERHPLHHGDIILEVDSKLVLRVADLGFQYMKPLLRMIVLRNGKELDLDVPLVSAEDVNINQVLNFCGAAVQKPSLSARMSCNRIYSEVYVTAVKGGTQAHGYGLNPQTFITQVNGDKVETWDVFWEQVRYIPYEKDIRLQIVDAKSHIKSVITLRKNIFFPMIYSHMDATGRLAITMGDREAWDASLWEEHAGIGKPTGVTY